MGSVDRWKPDMKDVKVTLTRGSVMEVALRRTDSGIVELKGVRHLV
jgi:hypothetical protein